MGFREEMFAHFEKAMADPKMGRVSVDYHQLFSLLILARKGAHAEGDEITPIPQHMREKPGERHPQNDDEHNPQNDPSGGALARSVTRINYAADYADPRAPDQMALVWRIDLLRLLSDWQHKTAYFEHTKDVRGLKPRPIETASRSITKPRVLLYWPQRGWSVGWYDEPDDPPANTSARGFRAEGDMCIPREQPTHWMECPQAPDIQKDSGT